jgi:hypothetical protein
MSREAFNALTDAGTGASMNYLFTAGAATGANSLPITGDVMIAVRTAPVYWRWGTVATTVSASTAATQGGWLPTGFVGRIHKPENSTHLVLLRDGGTDAQVYVTPGNGI